MITRLHLENLQEVLDLRKKYFDIEDKSYQNLGYQSNEKIIHLLENNYCCGKYLDNKLIGVNMYEANYFKTTFGEEKNLDNFNRKLKLFNKIGITNENSVCFVADLIDKEYRGKGI